MTKQTLQPNTQRPWARLLAVAVLVFAAGCAQQPVRDAGMPAGQPGGAPETGQQAGKASGESADEAVAESGGGPEAPSMEPELYPGTGEFLDREAARPPKEPAPADGQITLNFEGEDIQEIIKVILGDILGESYVISPGVSGKATFSTARPVKREQVLPILEMLLSWNNAAMIRSDGRWNIVPRNEAIPGNLVPRVGPPPERGYEVRAVPLKYIAPAEMQKLLEPFARQGAILRADNARGLLVLAGTPEELANYMETIQIFDVNWLEGMSVGIFPLQRVDAETIVEELMSVFGGEGETPLAGMFRFVPMERLNAVLAITPQPEYLREAENWVERLDRGMGGGAGARLYVYDVENVKAQDLADTLNEVFGGSGGRAGSRSEDSGRVAPGLEPVEIRAINDPRRDDQEESPQQQQGQQSRPGAEGNGLRIVEGEEISITAVEESNSLLIRATPAQYDAVLGAIKRLDTIPLQVLVEAKIVEVTLDDSLRYGVQWFFENAIVDGNIPGPGSGDNGGNGGNGSGAKSVFDRDSQTGFFGGDSVGGLTYGYTGPDAQVLLTALASSNQFRVLSAPSLMVLNNKEANIQVGNQIPVVSTTFNAASSTNQGIATTSSVQFRDTGVTLNVTPRVNPGGLVFLEIKQELSEVSDDDPGPTGNVPVLRRTIDTELAVQSGETVVLGGLISETRRDGDSGVPVLKDIPLLGKLFSQTSSSTTRQELLVVITPKVVRSPLQAQQITDEYRKKLHGLERFKIDEYSVERKADDEE